MDTFFIIKNGVLLGCSDNTVKKLEIPEGVSVIGSSFSNFTFLKEIILPRSLIEIRSGAFKSCLSLERVKVSSHYIYGDPKLATIGAEAFKDCISLKSFSFCHGISKIGTEAFKNCKSLIETAIPSSVEWIGASAFEGCNAISHMHIMGPSLVSENAFKDCRNLERIDLSGSLSKSCYISENAFRDCIKLTEVCALDTDYPLPSFRKSQFAGCTKLNSISTYRGTIEFEYFRDTEFLSAEESEKRYWSRHWRELGQCQYCGGKFKLFNKECRTCGKEKDY